MNKKDFKELLTEKHKGKYDYSKSIYKNNYTNIQIYCPLHKIYFEQKPNKHILGQQCPKCAKENRKEKLKMSLKDFIKECNHIFNKKYDYTNTKLNNLREKIIIKCPIHGDVEINAGAHLKGRECPGCSVNGKRDFNMYIKNLEKIETTLKPIEEYNGSHNKINHKCNCGYIWNVEPSYILTGVECPKCKDPRRGIGRKFYKNKKTLLYYVQIGKYWKIGITLFNTNEKESLKKRFGKEYNKISIVKTLTFVDGEKAWDKEHEILKKHKNKRLLNEKILKSGNTEIFSEDVLNNGNDL